jgi:Sigma-70 region 2
MAVREKRGSRPPGTESPAVRSPVGRPLVEVWRSASRFNPEEGSVLSWVMTMARRRALSHAGAMSGGRAAGRAPIGVVTEQAAASLLRDGLRGLADV